MTVILMDCTLNLLYQMGETEYVNNIVNTGTKKEIEPYIYFILKDE